jgi:hypothetical protein
MAKIEDAVRALRAASRPDVERTDTPPPRSQAAHEQTCERDRA